MASQELRIEAAYDAMCAHAKSDCYEERPLPDYAPEQEDLVDLLADLRHLAADIGLDFEQADATARRHFEIEAAGGSANGADLSVADDVKEPPALLVAARRVLAAANELVLTDDPKAAPAVTEMQEAIAALDDAVAEIAAGNLWDRLSQTVQPVAKDPKGA